MMSYDTWLAEPCLAHYERIDRANAWAEQRDTPELRRELVSAILESVEAPRWWTLEQRMRLSACVDFGKLDSYEILELAAEYGLAERWEEAA